MRTGITMAKCIYCLEDKETNREHVIPEAFGSFKSALTLVDKVCSDCNTQFGKTIDLILGRDTFEGMNRYKHGVKKSTDFKNMGRKSNLKIRIGEGILKGLIVEQKPKEDGSEINIMPLPQVGLRKADSTYDFFVFEEIPEFKHSENKYPQSKNTILIPPAVDVENAKVALSNKGWKFQYEGEFILEENKNILCEVTRIIDKNLKRVMAKIAFNFFAYFNDSEVLFHPDFNDIRNFVLRGDPEIPILVDSEAILGDEKKARMSRLGHIITLGTDNSKHIIVQVSLFNSIRYIVQVSKNSNYKNVKIGFGRFFCINSLEIHDIAPTKLIIPSINIWLPYS